MKNVSRLSVSLVYGNHEAISAFKPSVVMHMVEWHRMTKETLKEKIEKYPPEEKTQKATKIYHTKSKTLTRTQQWRC